MSRRHIAAFIVGSVAIAAAVPATANGWSFTLTPKGDAAQVIGTGMQFYGMARDLRNRAKTKQRGQGNHAAISQSGRGNNALIVQRGKGNSGSITQNGNYNSYGLFQFGRRNSGNVVQNGNGQVGLTFQGSW
jgi:major curlin subunit